jgi:hypothetical protein
LGFTIDRRYDSGYERRDEGLDNNKLFACVLQVFRKWYWQIFQHGTLLSAGLDVSEYESDGKYAMTWIDEDARKSLAATNMIVLHVVSLMPGRNDHS